MSAIKNVRIKPSAYAEAIARRINSLDGVHSAKLDYYNPRFSQVRVRAVFYGKGHSPSDELAAEARELQREFSVAFPDWGISIQWLQHAGTKVKKVERTFIADGYVHQELECGHRVRGEKIRKRRQCPCCSGPRSES